MGSLFSIVMVCQIQILKLSANNYSWKQKGNVIHDIKDQDNSKPFSRGVQDWFLNCTH